MYISEKMRRHLTADALIKTVLVTVTNLKRID